MSKKIDLSKLLTKGSAKQRASLLIYHYTILEAIDTDVNIGVNIDFKPILTDQEAKAIFDSFKDSREIKVYNDYRALHIEIIRHSKRLLQLGTYFERDYYKYLYYNEVIVIETNKNKQLKNQTINESLLIDSYSTFYNYYTALKIYAKEKGYTNKQILDNVKDYFKNISILYNYYPLKNESGETLSYLFSDIEPDYEDVKNILLNDFNYSYEKE